MTQKDNECFSTGLVQLMMTLRTSADVDIIRSLRMAPIGDVGTSRFDDEAPSYVGEIIIVGKNVNIKKSYLVTFSDKVPSVLPNGTSKMGVISFVYTSAGLGRHR